MEELTEQMTAFNIKEEGENLSQITNYSDSVIPETCDGKVMQEQEDYSNMDINFEFYYPVYHRANKLIDSKIINYDTASYILVQILNCRALYVENEIGETYDYINSFDNRNYLYDKQREIVRSIIYNDRDKFINEQEVGISIHIVIGFVVPYNHIILRKINMYQYKYLNYM